MSEMARDISQEYWRPAQSLHPEYVVTGESHCSGCGTQFVPAARFCHVCGSGREAEHRINARLRLAQLAQVLDFVSIRERLGLSTTSLVLVIVSVACVLATLLTGVIYSAATFTEWQAVQTWRIEWMLAAVVALVAAILFKESRIKE